MAGVIRFGVSIEEDLLSGFDDLVARKGYANRSDALRALIRASLLEARLEERPQAEVVGTITLVYDHHGDLVNRLVDLQHDFRGHIVSTLHVHVDADDCLEVLVVRGPANAIRQVADRLTAAKGVKHGRLTVTTTGKELSG